MECEPYPRETRLARETRISRGVHVPQMKERRISPGGGMVDTYAWGAYAERCVGSSPILGTNRKKHNPNRKTGIIFLRKILNKDLNGRLLPTKWQKESQQLGSRPSADRRTKWGGKSHLGHQEKWKRLDRRSGLLFFMWTKISETWTHKVWVQRTQWASPSWAPIDLGR